MDTLANSDDPDKILHMGLHCLLCLKQLSRLEINAYNNFTRNSIFWAKAFYQEKTCTSISTTVKLLYAFIIVPYGI